MYLMLTPISLASSQYSEKPVACEKSSKTHHCLCSHCMEFSCLHSYWSLLSVSVSATLASFKHFTWWPSAFQFQSFLTSQGRLTIPLWRFMSLRQSILKFSIQLSLWFMVPSGWWFSQHASSQESISYNFFWLPTIQKLQQASKYQSQILCLTKTTLTCKKYKQQL